MLTTPFSSWKFADDAFHKVLCVLWADAFWAVVLNDKDCTLVTKWAATHGLLSHLTKLETCQAKLVDGVATGFESVFGAKLDALQVAAVDDWVLVVLADVLQVHAATPSEIAEFGKAS